MSIPTDLKQLVPACGAFVDFHGGLHVMCFSLQVASIYAVGQVDLGIAADTKAGIVLHMKFGFGVELVVGLPVVANVSVLYMVEVTVGISDNDLDVGAMMLFRGSAEICGGLVGICIQIEAGGSIHRDFGDDAQPIASPRSHSPSMSRCSGSSISMSPTRGRNRVRSLDGERGKRSCHLHLKNCEF